MVKERSRQKAEMVKERSRHWYDRIVLHTFTDEQWVENFRMTRQTFTKVCRVLEPGLSPMEIMTVRNVIRCAKTSSTHDLLARHSN